MYKLSTQISRVSGLYQILDPRPLFVGEIPLDYNTSNIYNCHISFYINDIAKSFMKSEYMGNIKTRVILVENALMKILFNSNTPHDIYVTTTTEKHFINSNYKIELNIIDNIKLLSYENKSVSDYNGVGVVEVSPELNTIINNIKLQELNDSKNHNVD
jgi:hypothetical protein